MTLPSHQTRREHMPAVVRALGDGMSRQFVVLSGPREIAVKVFLRAQPPRRRQEMRRFPDASCTTLRPLHCGQRRIGPDGIALNLLASALAILTAMALLGSAVLVGNSPITVAETEQDDSVIHEFYHAVNSVLRSGDTTALDRVVAPDVVIHTTSAQLTPNRSGLEHYLLSLHATFPAWRLQVAEIVRDENQAIVRVASGSATPGSFLGLPLAAMPSPWGHVDRLRIADRTIVELWSDTPTPLLSALTTAVPLDLETPPQAIAVDRLAAYAGEHRDWGSRFSTQLLYVDEGALQIDLDPTDPPPVLSTTRNGQRQRTLVPPGTPVILMAGDELNVSPGALHRVWHDAADPDVVAYAIALPSERYTGPLQPQQPSATDGDITGPPNLRSIQADLEDAPLLDLRAGITVSLGRAHLSPGATLAFQEAEGFLLVVIEQGAFVITSESGTRLLNHRNPDDRALVTLGEAFALHNLGNDATSVLMVAVLPRHSLATPVRR